MGDLKQKFSGFLSKLGNSSRLSLNSNIVDELYVSDEAEDLHNERTVPDVASEQLHNVLSDEEVLESVEKDYFLETGFDASRHELQKLQDQLDCDSLLLSGEQLRKQQKVVSKQVLQLILQKQSACNSEFEKIQSLQRLVQETLTVCRESRRHLCNGKNQLTTASLGILANYRKRQLLLNILHSLNTIKTLQSSEEQLQSLLNAGKYEEAINQLLECQSAAATFRRYSCVAALSGKLQDTLVMTEEQLDVALAKVCERFDESLYGQLQSAYARLGKTQAAMDQLHMHFTSAIQNTALTVLQHFIGRTEASGNPSGKQYNELCKCIEEENFIPCLQELCSSLWKIVCSYHNVASWHQRYSPPSSSPGEDLETTFTNEYVRQKLESMQARIWQDVQARFSTYLLASNLASFKFDNFLQVLGLVHRLMEVGEEFCGSHSEELLKSIRQQSENYFTKYHAGCMEELRIFLENESWAPCPVKADFSCLHLQEFRSLRGAIQNVRLLEQQKMQQSPESSSHSLDGSVVTGGLFSRFSEAGSPFDVIVSDLPDEDILAQVNDDAVGYFSDESDEDVPDELKGDYVEEVHGEYGAHASNQVVLCFESSERVRFALKKTTRNRHHRKDQGPLLTNTTLTVLRHCGKYLQMSRLLRTVAMDVIICLSQLFQFYLYAVHTFFTSDLPVDANGFYSAKLRAALNRINSDLIRAEKLPTISIPHSQDEKKQILHPHISPIVNLNEPETLFGLAERIIAVESIVFLSDQLNNLYPYLEHLVRHEPRKHFVQQFYLQVVSVASDLRLPVYACVASRAVDSKHVLNMMSRVNWEIKEVSSQHSQYVDVLLREIQIFSMRLEDISSQVIVSKNVYNALWQVLLIICCNTFVEGFGSAKKCATGGRALMQLDFTQFVSKIERLTTLRPIPNKDFVEQYVKAYYLPEDQLEKWVRNHTQYTSKQLLTLVHCACQNNKKTRQRLSGIVEELERVGAVK